VLSKAEERGLHSADYDAALLGRRLQALEGASPPSARDVGWFDVALSVGVMRHVSDVHIGRVNPKNLSVGINVQQKKLDLAKELQTAIDRGGVAELVSRAEPRFIQYRNLKTAYARYRALAADSTIPTVKASGTLHRGDAFAGASALRRRLAALGDLSAEAVTGSDTYDDALAAGVARFQARHGLPPDSVLGRATLAAVNVPFTKRVRQLELALERIRWLPPLDTGPFVVVNVPGFELYAFDTLNADGRPEPGNERRGRQSRGGAPDAALRTRHAVHRLPAILGHPTRHPAKGDHARGPARSGLPGQSRHGDLQRVGGHRARAPDDVGESRPGVARGAGHPSATRAEKRPRAREVHLPERPQRVHARHAGAGPVLTRATRLQPRLHSAGGPHAVRGVDAPRS
jgi:hypothetical protein